MPPVCQDWKCVIQWMNDNPGVAGWVQGLTALIAVLIALWIATRQLGDALKLEAARRNADKRTRIEGLAALASSGAKLLAKVRQECSSIAGAHAYLRSFDRYEFDVITGYL